MSVVVGVLTIDLKANTASFSQSMDKMSSLSAKTANDIKRSLEKVALAGVALAASLVTGTSALIESSVNAISSMSRLAQSAGTTAEKFSILAYAAKLNHTPMEDLAKGLEKISQSAFKAQNGNAQLQRIFDKLGVATKDASGHLRDSSDMLTDVAVKFSQMGTAAGKPALAMALFGKAGAQLIPLLNDLGKHQAEIREEAEKYGLVIGNDVPAKVRAYHEVLVKLHAAQEGFGMQLTVAVLPALTALSERLQELGSRFDIAKLAEQFGEKVTTAVNVMVSAFDFATQHAHALKIMLEALAAVQVGKIAIPVIADLAGGGIEKVGAALSKLVISGLGLTKVIPALAMFGAWVKYTASFVGLLAAEEGIGAAATYVFGGALAAIGGPITLAVAAIVGLGVAIFKFRDATFSLNGTTYKLRDTWNAAWIAMGWGLSSIGKQFSSLVGMLKSLWTGLIGFFAGSSVVKVISGVFGAAFEWIQSALGKLTPQWVTSALDEAKKQRVAKDTPQTRSAKGGPGSAPELPPPDTSGLGKEKESPVGKLLANLQEKLDESKQTLAAAGLEEEAQRKVVAANKASNEIMKLGEEIAKQTGAKTKDYASLVDQETQTIIREKNAQISDNEAKTTLLNLLGTTSRASALNIAQSGLMVQAMEKGSDAVLRQTAVTQAWNELRTKGGSLAQILTRSQEIYAESVAKGSQSIQGNIISLQDELAAKKIVNDAVLGSLDAQDEAAQKAKLYALDVQIAGSAAGHLRDELLAQRAAMVDLNEEEKRGSDLQNARALQSPEDQYALEQEKLNDTVEALKKVQGGTITYGQSLQVAMKEQENFNHLIDETVKALLAEGTAADGMKAFFLDMQKQAVTAGQVIYDALKSTFDKLSENLTQLVTGGKTSFAKMFQDIGRQMVNSTIKSGLQQGLGALGKILPPSIGGPLSKAIAGKPDGSSAAKALWVRMATADGSELPNFGVKSNQILSTNGPSDPAEKSIAALNGIANHPPTTPVGMIGSLGSVLGALFGGKKKNQNGDTGIGSINTSGLGVGTGVMGTGVTSLGDDSMTGIVPDDIGSMRRLLPMPADFIGQNTNNFGRRLGSLQLPTPAYSDGSSDTTGITGIGPDANDGGDDSGGDGAAGAVGGIASGLVSVLGGVFGGGSKGKPDGSKTNPFSVEMAGGGGATGGILGALGGGSGSSSSAQSGGSGGVGGVFGFLGSLFSKGASSSGGSGGDGGDGGSSIWSQLLKTVVGGFSSHAKGGPISGPGTGTSDSIPARLSNGEFVVRAAPAAKFKGLLQHINKNGDKTPGFAMGGFVGFASGGTVTAPSSAYSMLSSSTLAAASGKIANNATSNRSQSSTGPNLYYTIDARGTDPVLTEQRTRTAILAAHNSAISNAVQVNAERLKRMPQQAG